jgi:hypothetical protein
MRTGCDDYSERLMRLPSFCALITAMARPRRPAFLAACQFFMPHFFMCVQIFESSFFNFSTAKLFQKL